MQKPEVLPLSLQVVSAASPDTRRSYLKFTASAAWGARRWLVAVALLALPAAGQKSALDQFTPVVVSLLTGSTQPFPGTDGKYHVVYELVVTNTKPTPATLKKVEVLDARSQGVQSTAVLASYEGDALVSRLRTLCSARSLNVTGDNPGGALSPFWVQL